MIYFLFAEAKGLALEKIDYILPKQERLSLEGAHQQGNRAKESETISKMEEIAQVGMVERIWASMQTYKESDKQASWKGRFNIIWWDAEGKRRSWFLALGTCSTFIFGTWRY